MKKILQNYSFTLMFMLACVLTIGFATLNWGVLSSKVIVYNEDNLIMRALFEDAIVLASFRVFSIFGMIFTSFALFVLFRKLIGAATINLWGLEMKSETAGFEQKLIEKEEIIEKLKKENETLRSIVDAMSLLAQ